MAVKHSDLSTPARADRDHDNRDQRKRGAHIEALASAFLQCEGLVQIAANVNFRHGELDLVMRDGVTVVFVEVRYRRHQSFGGGAASIDINKCRKLLRAAESFLSTHREYAQAPCRFDVIEASGDSEAPRLTWLRDAFRADDL